MSESENKIHVMPLGADWEVESQNGMPFAHEDRKDEAVSTALQVARDKGIETVIVHEGDGVTTALHPSESQTPDAPERSGESAG